MFFSIVGLKLPNIADIHLGMSNSLMVIRRIVNRAVLWFYFLFVIISRGSLNG